MKATAKAPANIAFIKYWGKNDEELRLPANSSISMNLSNAATITTVEFSPRYSADEIRLGNQKMRQSEATRVSKHLERIRKLAKNKLFAKVVSQNNFPQKTGIASSASGFAALTLAAAGALNLELSEKELSILARIGSGSAARSIPDGFVEWKAGKTSGDSYAHSLYNEKFWDLRDIILVTSEEGKKVSSTKGHENAASSVFFKTRLKNLPDKIRKIKNALRKKDIKSFGEIVEQEAIELHVIMMTQNPPLFYWNSATIDIIRQVLQWREEGLPIYFTLDAGPNVHLICEGKEEKEVFKKVKGLSYVKNIIINSPTKGARIIDEESRNNNETIR